MPIEWKDWPEFTEAKPPSEIQQMYEQGFKGAVYDPEARERLRSLMGIKTGEEVAHRFSFADQFAGQLVIPFIFVQQYYPRAWPGAAQGRGDCVSHDTKNAVLGTTCCEVASGTPDPISGKVEEAPKVSAEGEAEGVFSTEAIYWYRRHSGDGWSCDEAARVVMQESGAWLRQNYPDLGIDLTHYSANLAGKYGRTPPTGAIAEFGKRHLIQDVTECNSFEECRDLLGKGFFLSTCGGEGFASTRNEYGYSPRKGSWSHAMAAIGADDRDVIKKIFGEPLILVLNSWGVWNSGPRKIYQTTTDIPEGSFWTRWSEFKRRQIIAFAGISGWARQNLPNASPGFI
jgi:hypothetical protein